MSTPDAMRDTVEKLHAQLDRVILGKTEVLRDLLVAIFAGGHILLEDRPETALQILHLHPDRPDPGSHLDGAACNKHHAYQGNKREFPARQRHHHHDGDDQDDQIQDCARP